MMEPAGGPAIILDLRQEDQEAVMSDHWRVSTDRFDEMRGTSDDEAAYAAGWTISGLATLGAIVAVWMFAI
jgi:hypothetical protein